MNSYSSSLSFCTFAGTAAEANVASVTNLLKNLIIKWVSLSSLSTPVSYI